MIQTLINKTDHIWGVGNLPPVNNLSGNWTNWLQSYEPQSFLYKDTDECSQLGGFISPLEIYFNWLKDTGQIPPSFLAFLLANGYWNGTSFAFSERYMGIKDGTSINGNVMQAGYNYFPKVGVIPRSMLEWTIEEAALYPTQALMDTSYYDPSVITPAMDAMGQKFLSYIQSFNWGWIWNNLGQSVPLETLKTALQTSPIGVAVPVDVNTWNQVQVSYTGGTETQHCVNVYNVDTTNAIYYPTYFTDQYQPYQKQFQSTYFIPVCIAFDVQLKPEPTTAVNVQNSPIIASKSVFPSWLSFILNHLKFW